MYSIGKFSLIKIKKRKKKNLPTAVKHTLTKNTYSKKKPLVTKTGFLNLRLFCYRKTHLMWLLFRKTEMKTHFLLLLSKDSVFAVHFQLPNWINHILLQHQVAFLEGCWWGKFSSLCVFWKVFLYTKIGSLTKNVLLNSAVFFIFYWISASKWMAGLLPLSGCFGH